MDDKTAAAVAAILDEAANGRGGGRVEPGGASYVADGKAADGRASRGADGAVRAVEAAMAMAMDEAKGEEEVERGGGGGRGRGGGGFGGAGSQAQEKENEPRVLSHNQVSTLAVAAMVAGDLRSHPSTTGILYGWGGGVC